MAKIYEYIVFNFVPICRYAISEDGCLYESSRYPISDLDFNIEIDITAIWKISLKSRLSEKYFTDYQIVDYLVFGGFISHHLKMIASFNIRIRIRIVVFIAK